MADTTILNQTEQIPVMMKEDLDVLVDQIKQYVQSEKQIFQFASKDTFPQTGKVNLYYIDKTNLKVYIGAQNLLNMFVSSHKILSQQKIIFF